jgi:hypothetical protein
MVSFSAGNQGRARFATALVGWVALLWIALCLAPYLYAASDLIQWR